MNKHKNMKRRLSFLLVIVLIATILPIDLFSVKAADTAAGTDLISNGTFDSDLSGWTDVTGAIVADGGAMKITLDGASSAHARTDVAISTETSYTVNFSAKTNVAAKVTATVYEYTFDNKIVEKHTAVVEGATTDYETATVTFTSSDVADTLGVVLTAKGAAGDVYVDNVQILANEAGFTTDNPNDVNNKDGENAADIIHMKKAVINGTKMTLHKYADRNGDGIFNNDDVKTLRERLIGKSEDDSTYTNATSNAIGVKMETIGGSTEEPEPSIPSGSALVVSDTSGKVNMETPEDVGLWNQAYMATESSNYTAEHFVFTTTIADATNPNLIIGAHVQGESQSYGRYDGLVYRLYNGFYEVYYIKSGETSTFGAKSLALTSGKEYTFDLCVATVNGTTSSTLKVTDSEGTQIHNKTLTNSDATFATIPESGRFAVWSQEDRSVEYEITIPTYAGPAVVIADIVAEVNLEEPEGVGLWNQAYMATESSNYTAEHFVFTTTIADATNPNLIIGAHVQGASQSYGRYDGLVYRLYNGFYEVYYIKSGGTSTFGAKSLALTSGKEYTFDLCVATVNGTTSSTLKVTDSEGTQIHNKTLTNSDATFATIPESGRFAVWSQESRKLVYKISSEATATVALVNDVALDVATTSETSETESVTPAYFTTGGAYTEETFVFETDMTYTEKDKLYVGARMDGTVTRDRNAIDGLTISFHTDANNTYVQTYAPNDASGSIAAETFVLEGNEVYKFFLKVTDNEDDTKTLHLSAYKEGKYVASFDHVYTEAQSALIPSSGSFAMWSTGECRDVLYTMPAKIKSSVVIDKNGSAGTVRIAKPENVDTSNQAYLALEGPYTYEKFEITTTVTDEASPFLVLGARMSGISENPNKYQGATIALYSNFYEVYAPTYGTSKGAENYHTSQAPLTVGEEYTFTLQVIGDYLYFETLQDETLLHSKAFDLSGILPEKGSFMVWSRDDVRTISYKMPYLVTQGSDIKIPEGAESDTVTLTQPTSGYATLGVLGDYTSEYFEFTTTIQDKLAPNLIIGVGVDGAYTNVPKNNNKGVFFNFYGTNNEFYQIESPYTTNIKAKNISFSSGETYTFGVKVESLDNATNITLVVTKGDTVVHTYTYPLNRELDVSGNFVVWTKNYGEVSYKMPKDLLVGSDVVVAEDETIRDVKLVSGSAPAEGNANTLIVDGNYTTEQFEFTTCPGTNQTGAGNMNIGLRFDGATKSPYVGSGIIVRIYSNFYQVYQVTGGSYSHIKDKNYNTSGLVLDMDKEVTFNVRIDDESKLLHITVKQGNNTGSSTIDISAATSTSGDFVLWRFNNNADITYKTSLVTKQNPVALYAQSTKAFDMYAHIGPSNGVYTDENGFHTDGTNYRNVTTLQEYKDAGFNAYLMHGSDAVNSAAMIESAHWFPEFMEQCETVGLDVIIFDSVIHNLAASETSLVGSGAPYATQEDLKAAVQTALSKYWDYPAFRGISLVDEPTYKQFTATAQVINAINAIKAETGRDIYIHTVLLPFNGTKRTMYEKYTGKTPGILENLFADMKEAYGTYVDKYLTDVNDPYFSVDIYPNMVSNGNNTVMSEYFYNLQYVVQQASAKDKEVHLTIQSTGNDDGLKDPIEADIRFQLNSALGFGVKDIRYYTYWIFPNYQEGYNTAIMNPDGTKYIYDEVQAANIDAQKMAKVMLNFDYVKSAARGSSDAISNLTTSTLDNVTISSASQPTVVNQLVDTTNGYTGYMVLNASVPSAGNVDSVTLTISNYKYATYYLNGVAKTVKLTNGTLSLNIAAGDGIFVIPHN